MVLPPGSVVPMPLTQSLTLVHLLASIPAPSPTNDFLYFFSSLLSPQKPLSSRAPVGNLPWKPRSVPLMCLSLRVLHVACRAAFENSSLPSKGPVPLDMVREGCSQSMLGHWREGCWVPRGHPPGTPGRGTELAQP